MLPYPTKEKEPGPKSWLLAHLIELTRSVLPGSTRRAGAEVRADVEQINGRGARTNGELKARADLGVLNAVEVPAVQDPAGLGRRLHLGDHGHRDRHEL